MKFRVLTLGAVVLMAGVFMASNASAEAVFLANEQGKSSIAKGQTVDGSAYLAGNAVHVDGTVNGDVYCAASSVQINGTVNGDVLCAGSTLTINGIVNGDVRVAGATVHLGGKVTGNASVFGADVITDSSFMLAGDLTGGASTLTIGGVIGRDMTAGSGELTINGKVGRDVTGGFEAVTFGSDGVVGGNFDYSSSKATSVPDGAVAGEVTFTQSTEQSNSDGNNLLVGLGFVVAMAVLALLGALLMPKQLNAVGDASWGKFAVALSIGFAFVFLVPIAAVLLAITGVGFIAAYVLVLVWLLLMAITPVVLAYFLGTKVYGKNSNNILVRSLAGAFILVIVLLIPGINVAAFLVMLFAGVGLVLVRLPHLYNTKPYEVVAKKSSVKAKKTTA